MYIHTHEIRYTKYQKRYRKHRRDIQRRRNIFLHVLVWFIFSLKNSPPKNSGDMSSEQYANTHTRERGAWRFLARCALGSRDISRHHHLAVGSNQKIRPHAPIPPSPNPPSLPSPPDIFSRRSHLFTDGAAREPGGGSGTLSGATPKSPGLYSPRTILELQRSISAWEEQLV